MEITVHTPIQQEKFIEILKAVPICTVDVMFFNRDKNKVLLFKRLNEPLGGIYFSIGGRLLKNEKIEDAAMRQTLRETGLELQRERLIWGGAQEEIHSNSRFEGVNYHAVVLYYGYILDEDIPIMIDGQHSDYKWFDVRNSEISPFIKTRMETLLKKL